MDTITNPLSITDRCWHSTLFWMRYLLKKEEKILPECHMEQSYFRRRPLQSPVRISLSSSVLKIKLTILHSRDFNFSEIYCDCHTLDAKVINCEFAIEITITEQNVNCEQPACIGRLSCGPSPLHTKYFSITWIFQEIQKNKGLMTFPEIPTGPCRILDSKLNMLFLLVLFGSNWI